MEAGEDREYLDAMRKANIKGALVGVEAGNARRTQSGLQRLQLLRRGLGEAVADLQTARRPCAWFFHLRAPDR